MKNARSIIEHLELQPHPEGGFFKETYRSSGSIPKKVLGEAYSGDRNYATSIYFLLTPENFSAFHKVIQDEQWHFYHGTTLLLHMISPEGHYSEIRVGHALEKGEVLQYTVPGGYWFASEVPAPQSYALAGCTVAPGFDFDDFSLPSREELIAKFPQHRKIIGRLTHE